MKKAILILSLAVSIGCSKNNCEQWYVEDYCYNGCIEPRYLTVSVCEPNDLKDAHSGNTTLISEDGSYSIYRKYIRRL